VIRNAEELRGCSVEKPGRRLQITADFKQRKCGDGSLSDSGFGDIKAQSDVRLASEVIEFVWFDPGEDAAERCLVMQIGVVELQWLAFLAKMLDPITVELTGASHEAVDPIAFFQEELRKVGAILAGDSGNEGGFHMIFWVGPAPVGTLA
jgi:hypothetical protein